MHVAPALYVAGYRRVVDTLWPVANRPALRMAHHVYRDLAEGGSGGAGGRGMRAAIWRLRDWITGAGSVRIGP